MGANSITVLTYPNPPAEVDLTATSHAGDLVTTGWSNATAYANTAVNNANALLTQMQANAATLASLPSVSGAIASLTKTIGAYAAPTAPVQPANLTYTVPAAPVEPAMTNIDALAIDPAPVFNAVMPSVNLNIPAPDALVLSLPDAPLLNTVAMPVAPAAPLPDVPVLLGITVPTAPLLNIATFTPITPTSPDAAQFSFSFAEPTYASSLLDALKARLLDMVNGASTGLDPAVEASLWNRARAREIVNAGRKAKEAIRNFAMRGFAKPPGALAVEIAAANQEADAAASTANRDIAIKQAELEQENRKFAFEEAFKVESIMLTYANQVAQRGLDAARYAQEAAISLYQANVQRYQVDIQSYSARVEQWRAAIQAELTKLDAFKAAIEAQQLIGQINTQAVAIYSSRVEAAKSIVDMFRAQVEAANAQASINKTQIEAYGTQVDAYGKVVQAKTAEYDGYATRVKAETSKIEGFRAQSDAFNSQVTGFRALVDAKVAAKTMEIKINRDVPMDLFRLRSEVFRTLNEAEASRVSATADVFGKNVQLYSAQIEGQVGRMNAETGAYSAEAQYQRAVADNLIQTSQANLSSMIQKTGMLIEATKSGAQTAAQMAASALSAVNLTGSISASMASTNSNSYSRAVGFSYGNSASVSNSYTQSDNTNHTTT